jgi:hypothetical protein
MRGKVLCFLHIVKHKNGTRSVPGGIPTRSVGNDHGAAGRDWSAVRPPSSERRPEQARSHRVRSTPAGDWSAVRAPSPAGQLPQGKWVHLGETGRLSGRHRWQASSHKGNGYIWERLVGCQGAIAGRPAPTREMGTSGRDWSAVRPPSLAGQLPQGKWVHLGETGRLSGRHRCDAATRQASSHKGNGYI